MRKGNVIYCVYAPDFFGNMNMLAPYTTKRKANVRRKQEQRFYTGAITVREIVLQ